MKLSDKKYLNRLANNKYVKKHRKNNKMISVSIPNGVKEKVDKFSEEKDLKISQWIKSLIIKELENDAQTRKIG
jgi:metal-responsive CopG/Arc/MetJ family transcriptional regulator